MNSAYLVLAVAVSAMTLCGALVRFARAVFRLALAGRQLAGAVRTNTTATDALAVEIRTYRTQTDARLDHLENRRGRPHP